MVNISVCEKKKILSHIQLVLLTAIYDLGLVFGCVANTI